MFIKFCIKKILLLTRGARGVSILTAKPNLNPFWVTGFVDAEGCFTIVFSKRKNQTWKISVSFEINLHVKDVNILYSILKFFKVGTVYIRKDRPICVFRVTKVQEIIEVIIPHFSNFPLISCKYSDYFYWKEVVYLIANKEHLSTNGFDKILNLYHSINRGASLSVMASFPYVKKYNRKNTELPLSLNPYWVSGFTAGDGGFFIGLRPKTNQIYFRFHITQHSRDVELIKLFVSYFNCGKLNIRKNTPRCDFYVQDYKLIDKYIISHFDNYSLCNIKNLDYLKFKEGLSLFQVKKKTCLPEMQNIIKALNS